MKNQDWVGEKTLLENDRRGLILLKDDSIMIHLATCLKKHRGLVSIGSLNNDNITHSHTEHLEM